MAADLPQYSLVRRPSTPDGTLGIWFNRDGTELCKTIELPWLDNHPETSCIPAMVVRFERFISPKHGQVWVATDVPDRSEIEVHNANLAKQLLGCIGVGNSFGTLEGLPAVLNSVDTLNRLRATLPGSFRLNITWETPLST
ncbi:MAG: DUF5675 family protein [Bryobacteraceae bacterium]